MARNIYLVIIIVFLKEFGSEMCLSVWRPYVMIEIREY